MRFYRAKIGLICVVIALMSLTSCVFAVPDGKYTPAETPITFFNTYTSLTVDISPKYSVIIRDVPLTWDVNIRMDVLDDSRVSKITFYIEFPSAYMGWLSPDALKLARASGCLPEDIPGLPEGIPDIPEDFNDCTVEIKDSSGNVVGKMKFWDEGIFGEGLATYDFRGVVTADQYFMKGEYFSIQFSFDRTDPCCSYIFFLKGTADGNMPHESSGERWFYTRFGSSYSDIPSFPIPELPLGPLSALAASILALKLRKSSVFG